MTTAGSAAKCCSGGVRYGAADAPSDELTADLYEMAVGRLARMGIERYEISNFARPGWNRGTI